MASSGRKREKPPNKGSELLDSAENHSFFNMLGKNCVSLASGVTQLLAAEPPNLRQWTKKCTGVVALVKDYSNRAYYLRLYDLQHGQLWEQKLYINFRVYDATAELLTFEGDDCVFGLNFCSREEARNFKYHIDKRNETEQKAKQRAARGSMAPTNENNAYMMGQQQPSTTMYGGNQAGITSYGTVAHMSPADTNSSRKDNKSKKSKKDKKKIIRKEDISNPTNFQHMAHVGWDQDGGFSQNIYGEEPMDETVREILKAAGHNPELMSKEEIKFTYDFIEKWQRDSSAHQPPNAGPNRRPMGQPMTNRGSESVKAAAPPPPPPRDMAPPQQQQQQRGGPPPPRPPPAAGGRPPARPLPQPPPAAGRPANVPPPPPPPMPPMQTGAPPPPPPPPPPPMSGGAAPPPPPPPPPPGLGSAPNSAPSSRNNLLSEIQKGAKLKSVQSSPGVGSDDAGSRDTVMAQIRQGAQLKHVDKAEVENRKSAVGSTEMGGIAGALARALEERRKNMRDSEESSDDEAANDSEWEDD